MTSAAEIFLSASVPVPGREYFDGSDAFLIQCAVREFLTVVLGRRRIVWGGHPAITPMVWAACEDLGVSYSRSVTLYQSKFFQDRFPEENERFKNVVFVDAVPGNRDESLSKLRYSMLNDRKFFAAVFIGGMRGILDEFNLFSKLHPTAKVIAVSAPGGAARALYQDMHKNITAALDDIGFSQLFYSELSIKPNEVREIK